nr:putative reverse transcriptase domain, aspartic peptidase domain protein [Tanacetum cinerariifolium]
MDWLTEHHATIDCHSYRVIFGDIHAPEYTYHSSLPGKPMQIISALQARTLLYHGCEGFLATIHDMTSEIPMIHDQPIVLEFPDVFPDELPGIPPVREVEFNIELIPGAEPISKAPYRMAPVELKELKDQLQELLERCFIRPSVSPWGTPVLFVPQDYDVSSATPCFFIHVIYAISCLYIRSLSVMLSRISFHVLIRQEIEKEDVVVQNDIEGNDMVENRQSYDLTHENEEPNEEQKESNEKLDEESNEEPNDEPVIRSQNVYGSTDRQENEELNKEPNNNGNEMVVFDEVLVADGSKRWEMNVCGYFVGYRMSVNELRYNLRKMWSRVGKPMMVNDVTATMCKNGVGKSKEMRQNFRPNTQPPRTGNNKQVKSKEKHVTQFAYQPKNKDVNEGQGKSKGMKAQKKGVDNINVEKHNGQKQASPKKALSVHEEILSAMRRVDTTKRNTKLFCTFVYAANEGNEMRELQKDLELYKRIVGKEAWVMLGDMNVTLASNEHSSGSSFMNRDMNEFRDCINNIEMKDVAGYGLFYTWTKNLIKVKAGNGSGVLKKLHKIMGNENFIAMFGQARAII